MPNNSIVDLHPIMRPLVEQMQKQLDQGFVSAKTLTRFELFETYRDPERQAQVRRDGASNAGPWQSAHQYGLAADFAAKVNGKWSWDDNADWDFLRTVARNTGMDIPIAWDRGHVEHPAFVLMKRIIRAR